MIKKSAIVLVCLLLSGCLGTAFSDRGRDLKPGETVPRLHEVPDKNEITPLPRTEMDAKEQELRTRHQKDAINLDSATR